MVKRHGLYTSTYNKALQIYDKYETFHNGITDMLAIKVCKNTDDLERGIRIHKNINRTTNEGNMELMNAEIDFYGFFGLICEAQTVYV